VTTEPVPGHLPPPAPARRDGADANALEALARAEHRMIRLAFWQTLLAVAGAVIAVVALFAAFQESAAVRKQTAGAVWPYLQLQTTDFQRGDEAGMTVAYSNTGVGPAKVRHLRVTLDGRPVAGWDALFDGLGLAGRPAYARDFIVQRVLAPGETVTLLDTRDPALVRALLAAVARDRIGLAACYCSIFDDCWLAESGDPPRDPAPVDACPAIAPGDFAG
jgi:hypothetical protein